MRRILLGVVVVVGITLLLPGVIGFVAETEHRRYMEIATAESPVLKVEVEQFERGWFRSHAIYRIDYTDPSLRELLAGLFETEGAAAPALVLDSEFFHGPVPFGSGSLRPMLGQVISTMQVSIGSEYTAEIPGAITTRMSLLGGGTSSYLVEPSEGEWDDGDKWRWDGAQIEVQFNRAGDHFVSAGSLGALQLSWDAGRFDLGASSFGGTQDRTQYGLWTGDADFRIESFRLESLTETNVLGIQDLLMTGKIWLDEERFFSTTEIGAHQYEFAGWSGGPAIITIALARIDAQAMSDLYRVIWNAQASADPEAAMAQATPELMQHVQKLISEGLEIRLEELRVDTPYGKLEAAFDITFTEQEGLIMLGPEILDEIEAEGSFRIPATLIEARLAEDPFARDRFKMAEDAGYIVREGEDYVMEFVYRGRLLTINGMPMPIPVPPTQ